MMSTPIETIADALVAFILSLLRDPAAADDFVASPQTALASKGLQDVCMADVNAARPVVVDHPTVSPTPTPPPPPPGPPTPVNEIVRMVQTFSIDARSTIIDQSVNQNIWTNGGDVTQIFDQDAVVASGDHSQAAGDDATDIDSDVDVTVGDVAIGNETYDGSFNHTGGHGHGHEADEAAAPEGDAAVDPATVGEAVDTVVEAFDTVTADAMPAYAPASATDASIPEPADVLESDMSAGDGTAATYETDAASTAAFEDAPIDEPVEEN